MTFSCICHRRSNVALFELSKTLRNPNCLRAGCGLPSAVLTINAYFIHTFTHTHPPKISAPPHNSRSDQFQFLCRTAVVSTGSVSHKHMQCRAGSSPRLCSTQQCTCCPNVTTRPLAPPPQHRPPLLYVIMGVSGCGKSSVGSQLASRLQCPFYDADDYHPAANISECCVSQHPCTGEQPVHQQL